MSAEITNYSGSINSNANICEDCHDILRSSPNILSKFISL